MNDSILILGSGLSAKDISLYNTNLFTIVAVNNGHLATSKWKYWVHTNDFVGDKPQLKSDQFEITNKDYEKAMSEYGGIKLCGYSIMLASSYWVLKNLKPSKIYYLGADMNYNPDSNGNTHIYGVGFDIKKRKISDPDYMAKKHGNGDPDYLTKIYIRFEQLAATENVKLFNLSQIKNTRLPYERITENERDQLKL
jgi:hypothetical protein